MKKENSQNRGIPLSWQFVRPPRDIRSLRLPRDLSLNRRVSGGAKEIFMVTQTRWLTPTHGVAAKRVQRILIFDNHPESLRLVSGYRRYANGARTCLEKPLAAAGFAKAIADLTVLRHEPVAA